MAARVGEMMVVIRAQDYASRTLRRVGGELSGLSRQQQLFRQQSKLAIAQARQMQRIDLAGQRLRDLQVVQRYARELDALQTLQKRSAQIDQIAARRRDPVTGRFASVAALRQQLSGGLDEQISASSKRLSTLNNQIGNLLPASFKRFKTAADTNAGQALRSINTDMARTAGVLRTLHPELALIRGDADVVARALKNIPLQNLERTAHAMSGLGRTLQLFGAVGVAALGMAASKAANFNTEISLAATQARDLGAGAGQVQTRIKQLSDGMESNGQHIKGVLDLMQEYPARSEDMTAATYDIFSSMNLEENKIMDVAKGLGLLEDANKIAVAGGGSLEEATQAMITVLNNFDPQLKNTTAQFDTMFDIVRFGRMRLGDFNIMMNKIAPAAANAGNSLRDVGGAMAFLTTVMPSQRMVATGISRLMEALLHPDVVKGLRMFGVEAKTAQGKLRPLDDLMKDIAANFPELQEGTMTAADFFKTISAAGRGGKSQGVIFTQEGRRALTQIITHLDEYLERQRQIDTNTDEFNKSLIAQQQSLGVQWATFRNRLSAIVIQIGTDAIPAFKQLGDALSRILDWWQSIDPEMRQSIVQFGVFAAAGAAVGGVLLALLGSALAFEVAFRRLIGSVAGGTGIMRTFWMLIRRFAAIGTIVVALKVIRTGDVKGWELLFGILAGAAAGSRFGPLGAIAGGLVIPITLAVSKKSVQGKFIDTVRGQAENWRKEAEKASPMMTKQLGLMSRYADYLGDMAEGFKGSDEEFVKFRNSLASKDVFEALDKQGKAVQGLNNFQQRAGAQVQALANIEQAAHDKRINAFKKFRSAMKKWENDMATYQQDMRQYTEDMDRWKDSLIDATAQAKTGAVDNLREMYMEMEGVNRQAFGELFKGPWLTSETFDIAKEWGITPRIQDMIKDLNQQNNQFARWRDRLDKLLKRGVPHEFVDEIEKMGIEEGSPILKNILDASPQQVQKLIAQWKRREGQIKSATKMDFSDEINRFRTAGGNMGNAIIMGFQKANVAGWFDTWVKSTFPDAISSAVNTAVAEFRAQNPMPKQPVQPNHPNARDFGITKPAGSTGQNPGGIATAVPWTPWRTANQMNQNQSFDFHFHAQMTPAEKEAAIRTAAFVTRNAFKGAF